MKYERTTLITLVEQRIKGWLDYGAALEAKKKSDREKAFAKWEADDKPRALAALAEATRRIKAGKVCNVTTDSYRGARLYVPDPPEPYVAPGHVCNTQIAKLEDLLTLLQQQTDDEVSITALERMGIRNVATLLRQPC